MNDFMNMVGFAFIGGTLGVNGIGWDTGPFWLVMLGAIVINTTAYIKGKNK